MSKSRAKKTELYEALRPPVAAGAIVAALLLIVFFHFVLPDQAAKILIDRGGLIYPFSVQNMMWVAFSVALGELLIRVMTIRAEGGQLVLDLLPEGDTVVLVAEDLPPIYKNLRSSKNAERCFLPRLIKRCILQFQASQSIEQSASLLNTSLEMFIHEIDLRYSLLRYLSWFIPSLGFIGTVIGIGHALAYAGAASPDDPNLLSEITSRLAVSFDGTLLALALASIVVFLHTIVQAREERILGRSGEYCLDNLINRLYVGPLTRQPAFLAKEAT
ncbi:MotA/TolQ/ExbB proton channel family protein [Rhizobium leguminosarum]|uniref:MotA/TolQ/ExbB proton channel family protein n=1 Tax=Rhizobium leguminosarum TaxID=384 RepID=UPI0024B372C5|nr:MotA/TolQ/ExbB proton channel family protein [Rhizobium leguminosarum]WHO82577.1 MotA/TolQ/ExbB proton channel family protein [Rhizobium leguminosarum]